MKFYRHDGAVASTIVQQPHTYRQRGFDPYTFRYASDQIIQILWKIRLLPKGILDRNSKNLESCLRLYIWRRQNNPPLAYEGGKNGLIS